MISRLKLTKKRVIYLIFGFAFIFLLYDMFKPIRVRLLSVDCFFSKPYHKITKDYLFVLENRSTFQMNSILRFKRQKSKWIEKMRANPKQNYRIYIASDEQFWLDFDRPKFVKGLSRGSVPYTNRIGSIDIGNGKVTWDIDF